MAIVDILLKLMGAISPIVAVIAFINGQKNGLKRNSYDEGVKDTNIANSINNLAVKIEEYSKDTIRREEFAEWKNRVKVLENFQFKNRIIAEERA